ncbi:ornithine aminomutase subunit alpha [Ruminococcaceae bacterium OttesenSCG-928-D13]|nr:ornithine aminomutase subunit alpha [Ruminococcaceae bacterium OttesenSCG-928-D13]
MKRQDDFTLRRAHLANLSDDALKDRFWELAEQVVNPLLKLGYENTTPSIERSILLRMGFSSLEAVPIVDGALERSLLGHGAGNIVYKLAKSKNMEIREAGLALAEGKLWDDAEALFKGGVSA